MHDGLDCGYGRGPGLAVSSDSSLLASISRDGSVKVFDVLSFDMMAMMALPYVPSCCDWIFKVGLPAFGLPRWSPRRPINLPPLSPLGQTKPWAKRKP